VRVVLDTGVVLSSLLFPGGQLAWLPGSWKGGTLRPLASRETAHELLRALSYPKFGLNSEEIAVVLGEYLPWTTTVDIDPRAAVELPTCRDPSDQNFLVLAAAGGAEALVTGDRALLELAGSAPFPILTPSELRARLGR
jgi:putative PIN family toxin of toxin-antitoxin system